MCHHGDEPHVLWSSPLDRLVHALRIIFAFSLTILVRAMKSGEVFESVSHPLRVKILKLLSKGPMGFSGLKRRIP